MILTNSSLGEAAKGIETFSHPVTSKSPTTRTRGQTTQDDD